MLELNRLTILCGDALEQMQALPDRSVDCCVTSPPYYGLRDYGVDGQIGLEQTPDEYIARLVEVFTEVRRALADDGTLWVNIGDSYAGSGKGGAKHPDNAKHYKQGTSRGMIGSEATTHVSWGAVKPKNLLGIPWRLAFALQSDGWYLRQDIIWSKPNPMPESVTDRCTKSHEYIFLLSKSPRYYFDAVAISERAVGFDDSPPRGSEGAFGTSQQGRRKGNNLTFRGGGIYTNGKSFANSVPAERESHGNTPNPTGLRNKRSVWTVATVGYKEAHFATFPPELIRPCIRAGCRPGGTVLDPFFGSGTTGEVALQEGRQVIGIELNPDYVALAHDRCDPWDAQTRLEDA